MSTSPQAPSVTERRSDAECIARSLEQPSVFAVIYDRHHLAVFRYVRSRLGPGADDVVGDTFAEAFRDRARFDASRGVDALPWLLGIATHRIGRARNAERRWLRAMPDVDSNRSTSDPYEDTDSRLTAAELAPWLREALQDLRRRDRETLLLFVAGELSVDEVAHALGVPPGTVKSRLNRARRILAARLEAHR